MSGIVAAHGPFDPRTGLRMLDRLAHRGPDGQGSREVGQTWLGHRRLAIVDPRGGAQPLAGPAEDLWLVGDGEIYNHERVRADLGAQRFRTGSDHEAALVAYADEGVAGFERLWGVFALVIAGADGRFIAVRDSIGAVPLYWAQRDGTTLFASELKAFDEDIRSSVRALPPGHLWTPDGGLQAWHPFRAVTPTLLRGRPEDSEPPGWVLEAIRETVTHAVERMLPAGVPVGTFLSGGLDSSVVTTIAARRARRDGYRLPTFAAGLAGSSDLLAARRVAEQLGTEHDELVYTAEEAIEAVPEVIRVLESFEPSLVHSAVPNYLLARRARQRVKIVLIGEGADELFAGYSHYGELDTGAELQTELHEAIRGLHSLGLQRVDRVTSAHGLEPRIPFLDPDVVELAMALPPEWKLRHDGRIEKWLLRRAFEEWLPEEVVWRAKEQFGEGTGMNEVLSEHFGRTVSDEDLARERNVVDPPLRTREELAFYRLFRELLPGVNSAETVGRFAEA